MKKISFESYEKMASAFANFVDNKSWNADYERPASMKLMGNVKNNTILDACCAGGWYTNEFLKLGAKKVIGVDFSPNMIQVSNDRLNKANQHQDKFKFHCHDLNEKMDFLQDQQFDQVLSSLTLHYLKDWTTPLAEFNRVLKANGHLVISTHHPMADYIRLKQDNYFKKELVTETWNMDGHVEVQFYTRSLQEIINSITNASFLIESIIEPLPTKIFQQKNPKSYQKLTKHPAFILIKAIKK